MKFGEKLTAYISSIKRFEQVILVTEIIQYKEKIGNSKEYQWLIEIRQLNR